MNILVTGGAGFIGSQFVRDLVDHDEGARITVLDKLTYAGNQANLPDGGHHFVRGDIADRDMLAMLMPGTDVVVNFAAETHVDRSITDSAGFLRTNVLGVQTLLEAARAADVTTFLQVSTDEVYGSIAEGSWPETDPLLPNSPYAAAKAGADLLCRSYHRTYGMDVRVTRCSNNYGPYQFPEKVIPLFVTNLLRGVPVPLYGDGGNVRDWLHVADHCRGIRLVLSKGEPGEVYNIGGGVELSNRELTERLLEACGADWSMVRQVPDRLGHDRRYSVDHSKIQSLGYAPEVDFAAGLTETVQWYRDNPSWWASSVKPA
ncbi:dTDP-glucose 4,6-dehydratase [Actinoplanes sp. NBRC 103695]|uniref:dTDP-glucose 4,6-dehydratase n=1 Tax=Actinoplanes sp. NBRC 103695 TaxID=3032202 RepID=UPI0024A35B5B|nr:dTDP-glucose 4,6-dehydratase [Actinoplanes sp. NBRC 103695]GLZ00881.1 dTDP-glucose 4,6-dehydratase [Actinoplanes sp. NBRC 103695]